MVFSVEQTRYSGPPEVSSITKPVLNVLEDEEKEEEEEKQQEEEEEESKGGDDDEEVLFLELKENSEVHLQLTPQPGDDIMPLTGEPCPIVH